MAYDERLAARVRSLLANRSDVSERQMFGGLTFMVGGYMCCGINGDELIVCLDPAYEEHALARPHARPMDFTGRPMQGFVTVQPDGLKGGRLNRWVQEAVGWIESLARKHADVPARGQRGPPNAATSRSREAPNQLGGPRPRRGFRLGAPFLGNSLRSILGRLNVPASVPPLTSAATRAWMD